VRRVVLVVADGLRPDAVSTGTMPSLETLANRYVRAVDARTVRPSATVAALASLATGVGPRSHGLVEPGLDFLARLASVKPVARELSRRGLVTTVVAGQMSLAARPVARTLAVAAGARNLVSGGSRAREIAERAARELARGGDGLTVVYFPDCDQAGHARGWMSEPYLKAAREVDAAIGVLADWASQALLIVLADHGGGGVQATEHDEPHPLNERIPLILAGPAVRRRAIITQRASLLDVPPTLLWALGVDVPPCYEGRVLREAFVAAQPTAEVAA
jgi:predicted AlkP superfamily pyrophosphatase or phosphodiesterase